jgi:hypothetical protein
MAVFLDVARLDWNILPDVSEKLTAYTICQGSKLPLNVG